MVRIDPHSKRKPGDRQSPRDPHASFAADRRRLYLERPDILAALDAYAAVDNDTGGEGIAASAPCVIVGPSGSGKSALVAYWSERFGREHPKALLVSHYIGVGSTAESSDEVLRRLLAELERHATGGDPHADADQPLARRFSSRLLRVAPRPLVITIDALDRLVDRERGFDWIPSTLPAGVRLLLTTAEEAIADTLVARGCHRIDVRPLAPSERIELVERYVAGLEQSVPRGQIRRLVTRPASSNPLFLRTQLTEILARKAEDRSSEHLIAATDIDDLFDRILERAEARIGGDLREILLLLLAARHGLDRREISAIGRLSPERVDSVLGLLGNHLVELDGLVSFHHDRLRAAIERRYPESVKQKQGRHRRIARHFASLPHDDRSLTETPWQLQAAGAWKALRDYLADIETFEVLAGERWYDLLRYWQALAPRYDIEESYGGILQTLQTDRSIPARRRSRLYRMLGELFEAAGRWEAAERCYRQVGEGSGARVSTRSPLAWILYRTGRYDEAIRLATREMSAAERRNDRRKMIAPLNLLGTIEVARGQFPKAIEMFERMREIGEECGDEMAVGKASGNLMVACANLGRHAEAEVHQRRQLVIAERQGDLASVARAIGNLGLIYFHQGRLEESKSHTERMLAIAEEIGDAELTATAAGNLGNVWRKLGDLARGRALIERQVAICRHVGNRQGLSTALGELGIVFTMSNDHEAALRCHREQLEIAQALGDKKIIGSTEGNTGNVYRRLGRYQEALEHIACALALHREIGYRYGVTYWFTGRAQVVLELLRREGRLPAYLRKYFGTSTREGVVEALLGELDECHEISLQIRKPDTLFNSTYLRGRVLTEAGRFDEAKKVLRTMLEDRIALDLPFPDEHRSTLELWLAYLLRKMGREEEADLLGRRSAEAFHALHASAPSYTIHHSLQELEKLGYA